jgi:hypothetical protein
MKWMVPELRLKKDQTDVITEVSQGSRRTIWINGHAGSGKSIVLLYALKDYVINHPKATVCVVGYTRSLVQLLEAGYKEIPVLKDRTIHVFTANGIIVRIRDGHRYDAIFCDEVQDLPLSHLRAMQSSCNHLILAGDANQSIYSSVKIDALSESELTPVTESQIVSDFSAAQRKLQFIYRLKKSIADILRRVVNTFPADDALMGEGDVTVTVFEASSLDNEIAFIWQRAFNENNLRPGSVFAFLFYSKWDLIKYINTVLEVEGKPSWDLVTDRYSKPDFNSLNWHLIQNDIPVVVLGNGAGKLNDAFTKNKIIFTTYHSSKGLDFSYVYLPMIGSNLEFKSNEPINALLLVALSRSHGGLTISYSGSMNEHFKAFLGHIQPQSIDSQIDGEEIF